MLHQEKWLLKDVRGPPELSKPHDRVRVGPNVEGPPRRPPRLFRKHLEEFFEL